MRMLGTGRASRVASRFTCRHQADHSASSTGLRRARMGGFIWTTWLTGCGICRLGPGEKPSIAERIIAYIVSRLSTTENAPPGRRGASGVTTGRRDVYLYMCVDPWEVGGPD